MIKYVITHFESWLTKESLAGYIASISEFKNFNRNQNKHLLFKKILHAPQIKLDERASPNSETLRDLLLSRRSMTHFKSGQASRQDIANIFKLAYSISDPSSLLTTSPSAGGLSSTEVYFVPLKVNDLPIGLYHFNVENFSLEFLKSVTVDDLKKLYVDTNLDYTNAIGQFFFSVKTELMFKKYQFRALRLLYIEVGHIMMNFWLSILNQNFVGTSLGGGLDKDANEFLGIDGVSESFVSSVIFGIKRA